jgi:hypothetical protein
MCREPLDPEGWLRSLTAEALLRADPDGPLFPVSLALQAVANAFVMLGSCLSHGLKRSWSRTG